MYLEAHILKSLEVRDYVAILALIVSLISAGFSIGFGFYDRFPKIKTKSRFFPATQEPEQPGSPPLLIVDIANFGRRDVYLEYLYIQYGSRKAIRFAETMWEEDIRGRYRLTEEDRYEQVFDPDSDSILKDRDGNEATDIFFQDSLGRRYHAQNARSNIKAYLEAAQYHYEKS